MEEKKTGLGWKLLSFFIPIMGIILFFIWREERPKGSKTVLILGILGFVVYVIIPAIQNGLG